MSNQKKLQRPVCEVTIGIKHNRHKVDFLTRHDDNLYMCLGPGCGYTIGYLTGMHRSTYHIISDLMMIDLITGTSVSAQWQE